MTGRIDIQVVAADTPAARGGGGSPRGVATRHVSPRLRRRWIAAGVMVLMGSTLAACSDSGTGPGCQEFLDAGRGSPRAFELLGDAYFVVNPDAEQVSGAQLFPLMGRAVAGCLQNPDSPVSEHIG